MKNYGSTILGLIALSVLVGVLYQRNQLILPSNIITLAKFSIRMPKPDKVIASEKNGSSYLEVIGPLPGFPMVPSGPPVYIFESTGHVYYWTSDIGDTGEYWENWQDRLNVREISMCQPLQPTSRSIAIGEGIGSVNDSRSVVVRNVWRPVRESNPCRRRERAVS